MTKELIAGAVALAGVAGGGWQANEYLHRTFASQEAVMVAGAKADYLVERREEALVREIAELERRRNLTPTEREHLRNLRAQLDEVRSVRKGK